MSVISLLKLPATRCGESPTVKEYCYFLFARYPLQAKGYAPVVQFNGEEVYQSGLYNSSCHAFRGATFLDESIKTLKVVVCRLGDTPSKKRGDSGNRNELPRSYMPSSGKDSYSPRYLLIMRSMISDVPAYMVCTLASLKRRAIGYSSIYP